MKSSIYFFFLVSLLIAATSCKDNYRWIKGEGPNVVNTRMPGSFTGINVSISADVEVYKDSVFRVELHGQQNILNVIETHTSGSVLYIGLTDYTSIRKHNPITIKVFMPEVKSMDISGSGSISCSDDFICYNLSTNVSGSGSISFRGEISNAFTAFISGSGSITNYSNSACNTAKYTISGSGNIHSEWLRADDVDARISGSGDMRIHAVKTLVVHISGSGNIYYRGNTFLDLHISVSGKLRTLQ